MIKWGSVFIIALVVVGAIAIHVSNWNECRSIHSWLYCVSR